MTEAETGITTNVTIETETEKERGIGIEMRTWNMTGKGIVDVTEIRAEVDMISAGETTIGGGARNMMITDDPNILNCLEDVLKICTRTDEEGSWRGMHYLMVTDTVEVIVVVGEAKLELTFWIGEDSSL
jgi:hypothetical protein